MRCRYAAIFRKWWCPRSRTFHVAVERQLPALRCVCRSRRIPRSPELRPRRLCRRILRSPRRLCLSILLFSLLLGGVDILFLLDEVGEEFLSLFVDRCEFFLMGFPSLGPDLRSLSTSYRVAFVSLFVLDSLDLAAVSDGSGSSLGSGWRGRQVWFGDRVRLFAFQLLQLVLDLVFLLAVSFAFAVQGFGQIVD